MGKSMSPRSTSVGVLGHATLGFGTYGLLLLMVSDHNLSEHRLTGWPCIRASPKCQPQLGSGDAR